MQQSVNKVHSGFTKQFTCRALFWLDHSWTEVFQVFYAVLTGSSPDCYLKLTS